MKKLVRVLGLAVVLGLSFVSCTEAEPLGKEEALLVRGKYKYKEVIYEIAVDHDGDGIFNKNVMLENSNLCTYDNVFEYKDSTMFLYDEGEVCDDSPSKIIFEANYTYDFMNREIKTTNNKGEILDVMRNVSIQMIDGKKIFSFETLDVTDDNFVVTKYILEGI